MQASIQPGTVREAPSSVVSRITDVLRHRRAALSLPLLAALWARHGSTSKRSGN